MPFVPAAAGPDTETLARTAHYEIPTFVGPSQLAVADAHYLLSIHPPANESAEAHAQAMADIQNAVATCALAHNIAIVFDSSGESLMGVRVVLVAIPAVDLTGEVKLLMQGAAARAAAP